MQAETANMDEAKSNLTLSPSRSNRGVTFDVVVDNDELRAFSPHSITLQNTPNRTPQRSREPSQDRRELKRDNILHDSTPDQSQYERRYFEQQLDVKWMGAIIIVCFFTSGMIDAVAFNSWNCFVGMQTGNTVFAALGIGGQPVASHRQQYYKSLLAIGSFCVGTLFFNFIHRWHTGLDQQPSSRRRWVFALSFMIQALCIVIAAILVQLGIVSNQPFIAGGFSSGSHTIAYVDGSPRYVDLAPIAILSFEAAGQVCLSRVLSVIELPTIVLSTLYHDFTADLYCTRRLWKESTSVSDFVFNQFRRQAKRFMSIAALFCGALVGGEMYKSHMGMGGALWFAGALKFSITVTLALWRSDKASRPILPK